MTAELMAPETVEFLEKARAQIPSQAELEEARAALVRWEATMDRLDRGD